jgi:murein DD-endopeptidase MepM/ murein hydrolase activator NlpD
MQALARAALLTAAVAALARAAETPRPHEELSAPLSGKSGDGLTSPCPPGTLPDANVCIPVPIGGKGGSELLSERGSHREKSGAWRFYDQIPRRPERPSDYRKYRLPITPPKNQNLVVSGYDLDLPDEQQRRGTNMKAIGHGGIDIAQKRGTEIRLVNLEHQVGDAEVLFVGEVFGNSVVTRHSLREGGRLREYIIVFGHLEGPAPGVARGMNLREGSLVGFVGDSGAPGDVHLHFEVRQVRDGVNAGKLAAGELTKNDKTVVCDPRNVLPLSSE